ncbi:MAG: cyclic nucleotide-binding domain-containing protein [Anaerolineae bacterium]
MPYTRLLEQIDIFSDLDTERLERICSICTERRYEKDDIIFHENTKSDELYIILQGEVEILVDPKMLGISSEASPGPTTIATLRRGQSFGEVALVDEGFRSASARCAAPNTQLLAIQRDALIRMCEDDFEMGYVLMRNVASDLCFKIRQTTLMVGTVQFSEAWDVKDVVNGKKLLDALVH